MRKAFQICSGAAREPTHAKKRFVLPNPIAICLPFDQPATGIGVAADYMRHANERRVHLDQVLAFRRELHTSVQTTGGGGAVQVIASICSLVANITAPKKFSLKRLPCGDDHLNSVKPLRQQEKNSNATKRDLKSCRFDPKSKMKWWRKPPKCRTKNEGVPKPPSWKSMNSKASLRIPAGAGCTANARDSVYRAISALARAAKELAICLDLTPESAAEWLDTFRAKSRKLRKNCCRWNKNERWRKPRTASLSRLTSWWRRSTARWRVAKLDAARELLRDGVNQRHSAEQVQLLRMRLERIEQRLREQCEAERLLAEFCVYGVVYLILTNWKRCIRS